MVGETRPAHDRSQNPRNHGRWRKLRLDERPALSGGARVRLSLLGVLAQGGLRFGTNLVIGHVGGPVALGTSSTAIASAQLASLLGPSTSGAAASKFVARSQGAKDFHEAALVARRLTRISLLLALSLGAIAAAAWPGPEDAWWTPDRLVVFLLVLGYAGYSVARGIQFGSGHFWRGTAWDLATAASGLVGVAVVQVLGLSPVLSLLPVALSMMAYSISGAVPATEGSLSPRLLKEIRGFLFYGVVGTLSSAGLLQGSVLVARAVEGVAGAGIYSSALTLATPISMVAGSVSLALFPALARMHGEGDEAALQRLTDRAFRSLNSAIPVIFGPLVICGPSIQILVWGQEYDDPTSKALLSILLLACMANTLGVVCTSSITSRGQDGVRLSTLYGVMACVVCAGSWLTLPRLTGIEGVALGYLLAAVLLWLLPVLTVWRRGGHAWMGQVSSVLAAGAVLWAASAVARDAGWTVQIMASVAFCVTWALLNRPPVVTQVLRNRRRPHS